MPLIAAHRALDAEVAKLSRELHSFLAKKNAITAAADFSLSDECFLEGLVSRLWQAWGVFCRHCLFHSCLGANTSSGTAVPAVPQALTSNHVSAAAIRAKNKNASPPYWSAAQNSILRIEPTWGDVDVLSTIVTRLGPANAAQIQAAASEASGWAKAIQTIRNAAAHTNGQTMAEVDLLKTRFTVFPISHPVQALFWRDPSTREILFVASMNELLDAAESAIA